MDDLSALDLAAHVRDRRLSATQVLRHFLDRTARLDPELNSYATLDSDGALAQAEALDARLAAGEDPGPLAGVPVSVKDLIAVRGLPLTFGSRVFEDNRAAEDAPSVARLRAAGAVVMGKTTTSELGSKAVGDSPLTGITRNPWDPTRTPGGSSAGAAAGVAARLVPLALGTDGGGSIRIPGAFCGLVGIKGTYGRVPVWPASATPALAHVGPLARDAADAAMLFNLIAGEDERDASSRLTPPWRNWDPARPAATGLRVAWCADFRYGWASDQAKGAAHEAAMALAQALGVSLHTWEGLAEDPAPAWSATFYEGIARRLNVATRPLPEKEELLDPALAAKLAWVRSWDDGERRRLTAIGQRCREAVERAFKQFDLLLMPTLPIDALPVSQDAPAGHETGGPVTWSYFTYPFNVVGNPAATHPAGLSSSGLPLGLHLVMRPGADGALLSVLQVLGRIRPPPSLPVL